MNGLTGRKGEIEGNLNKAFGGRRMKIYVASSWRNSYQRVVVDLLREEDFEVYDFRNPEPGNIGFSWSEIDPDWLEWKPKQFIKALDHPIAEAGYKLDFDAMKQADVCIMVLPCGRSAHSEAGWMKGAGKKVYIYVPESTEPELMYKIYDGIFTDLESILHELSESAR